MKESTYESIKSFVREKAPDAKCVQCTRDGCTGYAILARPSAARTITPVVRDKRKAWLIAAQVLGWKAGKAA